VYSRITIKNFRGIESLEAVGLRRINLIVGRNNCGKSTLLEALFLLGGATNPKLPATLGQLRGQQWGERYPDPVWRSLCRDLNPKIPVEIVGQWDEEQRERTLRIRAIEESSSADGYGPSSRGQGGVAVATQSSVVNRLELRYTDARGEEITTTAIFDPTTGELRASPQNRADFIRTTLLSARAYPNPALDAQQFSSLLKRKLDRDIVEALRIIEPNVQRTEVLSDATGPSIYLDVGLDALVPLAMCGEGLVRLFSIILELIASSGGVLLIDEIENGLHYTVMPTLWKLLGELVEKHNVQVFGTTHSDEMMRSALEAFAGTAGVLGLFRIDKRGDQHVMVSYSDEAMQSVREAPFEVRG